MPLAPVYIFSSEDPFLKNDRSAAILRQARAELPDAEFMLFANDDFTSGAKANLAKLENELMDPGLFGGDRIIKIYLDPFNSTAIQVLALLAQRSRPGVVSIVEVPRVKKNLVPKAPETFNEKLIEKGSIDTKTKHVFGFLLNIGASIEFLYPPVGNEFTRWIVSRANMPFYQLQIEPNALTYLSLSCEGNLVAIDQFFQLVKMSTHESVITLDLAKDFLGSNSRYSGFDFAEAVLAPNSKRALNILSSIRQTNANITSSLTLIVSNFDRMLSAIAGARQNKQILRGGCSYQEKAAFFRTYSIVLPSSMDMAIKAAAQMPLPFYEYLIEQLAQASESIQKFDTNTAYQCLQNMAVSTQFSTVRNLKGI